MTPCWRLVLLVAAALAALVPACRATPPCSPAPLGCSHSHDISGQAPLAVDLCVAGRGQPPMVLSLRGSDQTTRGTLVVWATPGGVSLSASLGGESARRRVPDAELRRGRLRLNIYYRRRGGAASMALLSRSNETLLDLPVTGTDGLWVAVTHSHQNHDAVVCGDDAPAR